MASRPSFTLLEMVLVLALIVLLAALTIPSLDAMYGDYKVTAAADAVRTRWAEARAQAVNEGRPYRFAVVKNRGNFRVAPDSAEFWGGGRSDSAGSAMIMEDALPRGIRFTFGDNGNGDDSGSETALPPEAVAPDMWTGVATFLPDGTAASMDGADNGVIRIIFTARHATAIELKLRTLTGTVTAQPFVPEGNRR